MNALFAELVRAGLALLFISVALALVLRGCGIGRGKKIADWELKFLKKIGKPILKSLINIGRLFLKGVLKTIAELCTWLHNKL